MRRFRVRRTDGAEVDQKDLEHTDMQLARTEAQIWMTVPGRERGAVVVVAYEDDAPTGEEEIVSNLR